MPLIIRLFVVVSLALCFAIAAARADEMDREQMKGLDEQVQDIKTDVLGIAAELNLLEEKLLYPSGTQVAVFVALASSIMASRRYSSGGTGAASLMRSLM